MMGKLLSLAAAVIAVATLAMAGTALAAGKPAGKTYRWVDSEGVVHFGDSIPPEYASSDRQVLNEYGVAVGSQDGSKSAEELAAEKAAADKAEQERQAALLAAQRDRVLLDTYLTVDEIQALRDRRLELIDSQIRVTENYLQGQREKLAKLQGEAAAFQPYSTEPDAPPIDDRLARELADTMDSISLYEKSLGEARARKADVTGQFAADIERFKQLKASATP